MNNVFVVSSKELANLRNGATITNICRLGGSYRVDQVIDVSDNKDNTVKAVIVACKKSYTDDNDDLRAWSLDIQIQKE